MRKTTSGIWIPGDPVTTDDSYGDLVNSVITNGNVLDNLITNSADTIVEIGQATGGSLNGFMRTKNGFVFQWGRVEVPTGPGARVILPKPSAITITVNVNCISGMYLAYAPGDLYAGNAFNVATNSAHTEEVGWRSVGRM